MPLSNGFFTVELDSNGRLHREAGRCFIQVAQPKEDLWTRFNNAYVPIALALEIAWAKRYIKASKASVGRFWAEPRLALRAFIDEMHDRMPLADLIALLRQTQRIAAAHSDKSPLRITTRSFEDYKDIFEEFQRRSQRLRPWSPSGNLKE